MGWFTEDELRRVAGDASFRRGRSYVGSVAEVRQVPSGVRAVVRGTSVYEVWLGDEAGSLVGECDCPFGAAGNFCKHCVAVGLTVLGRSEPVPRVAVLRRRLVSELSARGYFDVGYVDRANGALDTVRSLITSGHAAEARPLAREAVELIMAALSVDDSVAAVYRRALSLYARACAASRPHSGWLAEWLYRQWVDGSGWPVVELGWFVDALGDAGLAVYRELVAATPPEVPVLRAMREQLATVDGDVDALVSLISEDLPAVRAYQRIVAVLSDAGRGAEAIRWAERGVSETGRLELTELLVRSYVDGGRAVDAVEVRKAELRRSPTRVVYGRLRATAEEVGEWAGVRDWALAVLAGDCTELVGALLDDGEVEEAWRAVKDGCGDLVRLEVAREWGEVAPAEVLGVYRELVEGALARGGRESYRQAGVLLRELAGFSLRCGADVGGFVDLIRERYRRRPALLEELRRAGF